MKIIPDTSWSFIKLIIRFAIMYFLKVYSTPYVDKRSEYISNNDKGMVYLNGILKGRDHISHMVNMHYFLKNLLLFC